MAIQHISSTMTNLNKNEINLLIDITKEAGKIAMSHFGSKNLQINKKSDDSLFATG